MKTETTKKELRFGKGITLETRADGGSKIVGYAAVFNSEIDFGPFSESIKPGAFSRSLKESPDVRALLDHDTGMIIARTNAGNLTLSEDNHGLKVEMSPIDTEDGRKALEWVRSGVVDGMSFGFIPQSVEWSARGNDKSHRTITEAQLFEVSLVAFPAYPATSASIRSASEIWNEHTEEESKRLEGEKRNLRSASRRLRILGL